MTQEEFDNLMEEWETCFDSERKEKLAEMIASNRKTGNCGLFIGTTELLNPKTKAVEVCVTLIWLSEILDDYDSPDGVSFTYDYFVVWPDGHYSEIDNCLWGYISALDMAFADNIDISKMYDVSNEIWAEEMLINHTRPFKYDFLMNKMANRN